MATFSPAGAPSSHREISIVIASLLQKLFLLAGPPLDWRPLKSWNKNYIIHLNRQLIFKYKTTLCRISPQPF